MRIVFPEDWILNRLGKELDGLRGDGTYFVNYALYDESQPRPHGCWFTHLEEKWQKKFDEVAGKVDFAACPNKRIKKYLEDKGVKRVEVMPHGHDPRLKKKITFGVAGRVYKDTGRKGEYMVKNMVDEKFNVLAMGDGWPCEKFGSWEQAPAFYKAIDYLVITSLAEGGPVPQIEAIAAGVPVIAPDVGHCWEFPVIKYKRGSWESLKKVLDKLTYPPTWQDWRSKHKELFNS